MYGSVVDDNIDFDAQPFASFSEDNTQCGSSPSFFQDSFQDSFQDKMIKNQQQHHDNDNDNGGGTRTTRTRSTSTSMNSPVADYIMDGHNGMNMNMNMNASVNRNRNSNSNSNNNTSNPNETLDTTLEMSNMSRGSSPQQPTDANLDDFGSSIHISHSVGVGNNNSNSNSTPRTAGTPGHGTASTADSTSSAKSGAKKRFFMKFRRKTKKYNNMHAPLDLDLDLDLNLNLDPSDKDPAIDTDPAMDHDYDHDHDPYKDEILLANHDKGISTPSSAATAPTTPFTDASTGTGSRNQSPTTPLHDNDNDDDGDILQFERRMTFLEEDDADILEDLDGDMHADAGDYANDNASHYDNETAFSGNHSHMWETEPDPDEHEHEHDHETGFQSQGLEHMDRKNIPSSGVDNDGFFTADFDFSTPLDAQVNASATPTTNTNAHANAHANEYEDESNSVFRSFDAAEEWKPTSSEFDSFGGSSSVSFKGKNEIDMDGRTRRGQSLREMDQDSDPREPDSDANANANVHSMRDDYLRHIGNVPAVYSSPSPERKYDAHDQRYLLNNESPDRKEPMGPIDVDTQQEWDPNDRTAVASAPVDMILQEWDTNSLEFQSGKQEQVPVTSTRTGTNPIDIDTGEPWTPEKDDSMWEDSNINAQFEKDEGEDSIQNSEVEFEDDTSHDDAEMQMQQETDDRMQNNNLDEMDAQSFDEGEFEETHNIPVTPSASTFAPTPVTPQAPTKKGAPASLTLGVLAQISGLVDFNESNTDRYGRTFVEKEEEEEDDVSEGDDAVSKASRPFLNENENSIPFGNSGGHLVQVVNFHEDGKTMEVLNPGLHSEIALPFKPDASKIEKVNSVIQEDALGVLYEGQFVAESTHVVPSSPFDINVSKIHNHSHHHLDQVDFDVEEEGDISGNLAAPRVLEDVFDFAGSDGEDTVEAELEMEQLVSQVEGAWNKAEEPLPSSKKEHSNGNSHNGPEEDHNVSNLKEFWKQKQHKMTSIKTDPVSTQKVREVEVDWPDAPVSSPLEAKEASAFGDDFFSRTEKKKKKQEWDVPTSVTTTPQIDPSFATEMSSMCDSYDLTEDGFQVPKRKSAKEAYRANANASKSFGTSESAKGFFWRSHPEGGVSKVEVKARRRSSSSKQKMKNDGKETIEQKDSIDPSEYVDFPKTILSRRSRDEEDPLPTARTSTKQASKYSSKMKPGSIERVKSMPKQESRTPFAWDKDSLKLRKVNLSRSKSTENTQGKDKGKSMEWRKTIEAKIKSTSEKVKAAANNAKSGSVSHPTSTMSSTRSTEAKPPPAPTPTNTTPNTTTTSKSSSQFGAYRRSQSPFQANRNSFLSRRKDPPPPPAASPGTGTGSNIVYGGIPRTIEKKPLDDDAISGCSSSMADRIKAFETNRGDAHSKPSMFSRSAPLNSYALSKLRNVTSNVGGLWS